MKKLYVLSMVTLTSVFLFAGCNGTSSVQPASNVPVEESEIKPEEITVPEDVTEDSEPVTEVSDVFEPVEIRSLPSGADVFLNGLNWSGNYDCESEEEMKTAICFMMEHPYSVCDFSLYKDFIDVPSFEDLEKDPEFFKADSEANDWSGYYIYDADGMDKLLENIFNVDDDMLAKIKNPDYFEELFMYEDGTKTPFVYYEDGKYYAHNGGIGGPGWNVEIVSAERAGDVFHFVYDVTDDYEGGQTYTRYAVMEFKTIDGNGYWTVYKTSDQNIF